MNKMEFITLVAEKAGFTKKDTTAVYDAMMEAIAETLIKGEDIKLLGIGTIRRKVKPERTGYNPFTGGMQTYPAKYVPKMTFSSVLKKTLGEVEVKAE